VKNRFPKFAFTSSFNLYRYAKTALRSKLREELADQLTTIVVDAVLCIAKQDEPIDLHMVGGGLYKSSTQLPHSL
jgi:chaperonin GroEL (HSP60 family)